MRVRDGSMVLSSSTIRPFHFVRLHWMDGWLAFWDRVSGCVALVFCERLDLIQFGYLEAGDANGHLIVGRMGRMRTRWPPGAATGGGGNVHHRRRDARWGAHRGHGRGRVVQTRSLGWWRGMEEMIRRVSSVRQTDFAELFVSGPTGF